MCCTTLKFPCDAVMCSTEHPSLFGSFRRCSLLGRQYKLSISIARSGSSEEPAKEIFQKLKLLASATALEVIGDMHGLSP